MGRAQSGCRPVLVLSSDRYHQLDPNLVAGIPLTTRLRGWPTHVEVRGLATGLMRQSVAMVEQTKSMSVERLLRLIGRADDETMNEIAVQLRAFLDIEFRRLL